MPTLPDLFDELAAHGEHAGADAVVARAVAAAHDRPVPVPTTESPHPRRARRYHTAIAAAVVTIALVSVPVALRESRTTPHPSRQPSGPPYPPVASATAARLATLRWSPIADSPIPITPQSQVIAWTGDELVVFGQDNVHANPRGAGVAYSPITNRWRKLPRAPLAGDWFFPPSAVWTGRELIVFPNALSASDVRPRGEAYSPRTNSWRVLAPAPLCTVPQAGIAWTGSVMVVGGGYNISGSGCPAARARATAAYDPARDVWTQVPTLPSRSGDRLEGTKLVWAGDRVVAVVATQRLFAGPPLTNPTSPLPPGTHTPLTRSDPIVRTYSWQPGATRWLPLPNGAVTTFGTPYGASWTPYGSAFAVVFPPRPPFCGEGELTPCTYYGPQNGTVYDVRTHLRVALTNPPDLTSQGFDTFESAGAALVGTFQAGSKIGCPSFGGSGGGCTGPNSVVAWDIATGRRVALATPPERVQVAVWTGRELIAFALPAIAGPLVAVRLGP